MWLFLSQSKLFANFQEKILIFKDSLIFWKFTPPYMCYIFSSCITTSCCITDALQVTPVLFPCTNSFFKCVIKMLPCHKFWAVKTCFNTNRHTCLSHPPHCGSRSETLVVWGPLFTNQPRGITVLWKNRQSMQGGCLRFTQPVFWIWIRTNPHRKMWIQTIPDGLKNKIYEKVQH